jgi:carboxypeptidase D
VHAERNWTFAVFYNAGHQVAVSQPAAAYAFARDYIFGSNSTLFQNGHAAFAQVQNPTFEQDALPALPGVMFMQSSQTSSTAAPEGTVAAFYSAIGVQPLTGTAPIATPASTATTAAGSGKKNAASMLMMGWETMAQASVVGVLATLLLL